MKPFKRTKTYIMSAGQRVYVEIIFPRKPARSAVIFCGGLRSHTPGFLNNFALAAAEAGYAAVKFDYVGTGRSDGKFEDKLTSVMLKNLKDVIDFVAVLSGIKRIAIVTRSNSGSLLAIHGRDKRITALSLVAMPVLYAKVFELFLQTGTKRGKYLYHKSFKRKHTKGPGRLPLAFFAELKKYEPLVFRQVKYLRNAIYFQSDTDEVLRQDGHFEYLQKHLPKPNNGVLVHGVSHSFLPNKQHVVIIETLRWFKRFL